VRYKILDEKFSAYEVVGAAKGLVHNYRAR
jgi:hypothetical protein